MIVKTVHLILFTNFCDLGPLVFDIVSIPLHCDRFLRTSLHIRNLSLQSLGQSSKKLVLSKRNSMPKKLET